MAKLTYTQVAAHVSLHNKSSFSGSTIVSLIYKESRFDPNAKASTSTATGLMQMTKTALGEVNRVNKSAFKHSDMTDPATNIKAGTSYLAICLKRKSSGPAALDYYGTGSGYSTKIVAAAAGLDALPTPITEAAAIAVLVDKIGKQ
jgi:soluble lytic murein transglycosylase-like protein